MRLIILVLLLLVILVMLALAWHVVGMPGHGTTMLGACMAIIAVVGLLLLKVREVPFSPEPVFIPLAAAVRAREVFLVGRYPPDQGTILRH